MVKRGFTNGAICTLNFSPCSTSGSSVRNQSSTRARSKIIIPVILEAAALLTAQAHPNHIEHYAHRDELACCRAATPII
ncbi:hypothetical protein THF1A12_360043 [Vibrio jasicida]|uniref:Uncharacterized protein n=1 Tax=Vibrio jasicida TaxID=766224 RepID=A0AAU9QQY4_9VIBR|nr:hypothetical protein THF1A12_360043 [Vibrio jasicida]